MRNFVFSMLFFSLYTATLGQEIRIGQSAVEIKSIVEMGVNYQNNTAWDVRYNNGKITSVILCYYDEFIIDIGVEANFCKHFIMKNEKLDFILTQYEEFSLQELEKYYKGLGKFKFENYYFSEDYRTFSEIYLHENGLATVKWSKTLPANFQSPVLREKLDIEFAKQDEEENLKKEKAIEKNRNEELITSKIYNLKTVSPEDFEYVVSRQIDLIRGNFFLHSKKNSYPTLFPSLEKAKNTDKKFIRIKNSYNVEFTSRNDRSLIIKVEHLSGSDSERKLFDITPLSSFPVLKVEGLNVKSQVKIENMEVDLTSGITEVRIRNGNVKFEEFPPEGDLQIPIEESLKKKSNGKYIVEYQVANIMGELKVISRTTQVEKNTHVDFFGIKF